MNGSRGDGKLGPVHHPGHQKLHLRLVGKSHLHGGLPKDGKNISDIFSVFHTRVSLTGNGDSPLLATGGVKHCTHLARLHTRIFSCACGSRRIAAFCARHLTNNHHAAHMPCSVHSLTHLTRHRHFALPLPLPCCSFQIGHHPLLRCLADSPNDLPPPITGNPYE